MEIIVYIQVKDGLIEVDLIKLGLNSQYRRAV